MTEYKVGKIYKIIHNQSNICYVGSTFNTLRDRWQGHKQKYQNNGTISIYKYFNQFGINNFKIILIKEYDVCDRKHLLMYEQLWMNKMKCINQYKSFQPLIKEEKKITDKIYREANLDKINYQKEQYRKNNKEKIKQKDKEYYEKNKEKIRIKQAEKFDCECSGKYTITSKLKHLKTKKHLSYLDKLNL